MKLNKFFMLAMAGLAMTACSNDDEMGNNLSGNGVVEVKIVAPQSRALETPDASTDNKVTVEGDIYVKLTADQGGDTKKVTADGCMVPHSSSGVSATILSLFLRLAQ